ncbi:hypothetical protein B0H13DRAFT_1927549 [Mycena leptocephala]|nr:hypothetical protein B0H13DRAFT_1927549 [Mycena leptocephala]
MAMFPPPVEVAPAATQAAAATPQTGVPSQDNVQGAVDTQSVDSAAAAANAYRMLSVMSAAVAATFAPPASPVTTPNAGTPPSVAVATPPATTQAAAPTTQAHPATAGTSSPPAPAATNALTAQAPLLPRALSAPPRLLVPMLTGPWIAGAIYGVIPTGPLALVPNQSGEKWYAITKGRYVGVTNSTAIADGAVTRVSHALRTLFSSQADAVQAFNAALAANLGLIEVV